MDCAWASPCSRLEPPREPAGSPWAGGEEPRVSGRGPAPCHSLVCDHGLQFPHLSERPTALSGPMQSLDVGPEGNAI